MSTTRSLSLLLALAALVAALCALALAPRAHAASTGIWAADPAFGRIYTNPTQPFGRSGTWPVGDVNGDGLDDVAVLRTTSPFVAPELFVVFSTSASQRADVASLGTGGFRVTGLSAAWNVAALGDLNHDGLADFAVGDPGAANNAPGGQNSGSVYVIFGKAGASTVDVTALGTGGFRFDGVPSPTSGVIPYREGLGFRIANAGDLNGDGVDDLLASDPRYQAGDPHLYAGRVYGLYSQPAGTVTDLSAGVGTKGFAVAADGLTFGRLGLDSVQAVGDQDGDGINDFAVSPGAGDIGVFASPASPGEYVTSDTGRLLLHVKSDATSLLDNCPSNCHSTSAVADLGDQDGDGRDDLAVGIYGANPHGRIDAGAIFGLYSSKVGSVVNLDAFDAEDGFEIDGAQTDQNLGYPLRAVPDLDGDGRADLLSGTVGGGYAGYVMYTPELGARVDLADQDFAAYSIEGSYGDNLASVGDLDGDGFPELLLGITAGLSGRYGAVTIYSVPRPDALTGPAVNVEITSAQTTGTVQTNYTPSASKTVSYRSWFEYGADAGYGERTPETTHESDGSDFDVAADLTGLDANSTYHYRLVTYNDRGLVSYGADRTVTTGETQQPQDPQDPDDTPTPRVPDTDVTDPVDPPATDDPGNGRSQLLACSTRKVVLTNVYVSGSRVRLSGIATDSLVGKRVAIVFGATGKTVAHATVTKGGTFSATAPVPSKAVRGTNRARYEARVGASRSLALKLARRTVITGVRHAHSVAVISGYVTGPFTAAQRAGRAKLVVQQRSRTSCKAYKTVRTVKLAANGRFRVSVPGESGTSAVLRLTTTVAYATKHGAKTVPTFSLPIAVDSR